MLNSSRRHTRELINIPSGNSGCDNTHPNSVHSNQTTTASVPARPFGQRSPQGLLDHIPKDHSFHKTQQTPQRQATLRHRARPRRTHPAPLVHPGAGHHPRVQTFPSIARRGRAGCQAHHSWQRKTSCGTDWIACKGDTEEHTRTCVLSSGKNYSNQLRSAGQEPTFNSLGTNQGFGRSQETRFFS